MAIEPSAISVCPQCRSQLAPLMLACPNCGRLVHAEQLTSLAKSAGEAQDRGDLTAALAAWREALELLPVDSKQHQALAAKVTALGQELPRDAIPVAPNGDSRSPVARAATGAGVVGVLLWKSKALLLGLTKGTTALTMLLSLGVYWTAWGWKFALGLVLSIYVHEMGHVIALRRYGFKATAPMFVPGVGAFVRLQQKVINPQEDADIGLAGPIYGLGAALVSLGLWFATQLPIFAAIANFGAMINLLNLAPFGTLDGGRAFHALSRFQKLIAAGTMCAAWLCSHNDLLMVVAFLAVFRALEGKLTNPAGSRKTTLVFCFLVAALTAIMVYAAQFEPAVA